MTTTDERSELLAKARDFMRGRIGTNDPPTSLIQDAVDCSIYLASEIAAERDRLAAELGRYKKLVDAAESIVLFNENRLKHSLEKDRFVDVGWTAKNGNTGHWIWDEKRQCFRNFASPLEAFESLSVTEGKNA